MSQNHKPCTRAREEEVQQGRESADRTRGRRARGKDHQPAGLYTLVVTHGSEEHAARLILKAP